MIAGTTFPSHASQPAEIADLVGVRAFQIQAASAAVFAPDGKRLASVVCDPARIGVVDDPNICDKTRSSANAPYGSLGCDIWIYPVSGGKKKNLMEAKGSNWSPAWWPDGGKLAFHSDRDGVPGVWVWTRTAVTGGQVAHSATPQWPGHEIPRGRG